LAAAGGRASQAAVQKDRGHVGPYGMVGSDPATRSGRALPDGRGGARGEKVRSEGHGLQGSGQHRKHARMGAYERQVLDLYRKRERE
jgi:hypothetical protein